MLKLILLLLPVLLIGNVDCIMGFAQMPASDFTRYCPYCADPEFLSNVDFYQNQKVFIAPDLPDDPSYRPISPYPACNEKDVQQRLCHTGCLNVTIKYTEPVYKKKSEAHLYDCNYNIVQSINGSDSYRKFKGNKKHNVTFTDKYKSKVDVEIHFWIGTRFKEEGTQQFYLHHADRMAKEQAAKKAQEEYEQRVLIRQILLVLGIVAFVIIAVVLYCYFPVIKFNLRKRDMDLAVQMAELKIRFDGDEQKLDKVV